MPAYNFKPQFADAILTGQKLQTIRRTRKNGNPVRGSRLYLYTGQRTLACKKLLETTCTRVDKIHIHPSGSIYVNGHKLDNEQRDSLATSDGFPMFCDFMAFFLNNYGLPFYGIIIKWE